MTALGLSIPSIEMRSICLIPIHYVPHCLPTNEPDETIFGDDFRAAIENDLFFLNEGTYNDIDQKI